MQKTLLFLGILVLFACVFVPSVRAASTVPETLKMPLPGEIITIVNKERSLGGLPALKVNTVLSQAASLKAQSLVELGALQHTQTTSGVLWWPLTKAGYEYSAVGENLAQGISDPVELVKDWMNSPTHRANIVNPNYTEIGVAVVMGEFDGYRVPYVVEYTATPKASIVVSTIRSDSSKDAQIQIILKKIIELMNLIIQMRQQGIS